MIERRKLAVIAAVALGLLGLGAWLREPAATPAERVDQAGQAQAAPTEIAPDESPRYKPGKTSPESLPPQGTPINLIVGALQTRADAGDSRAACRLGIELVRCQQLEQAKSIQWADGLPPDESLARRGQLDAADRFAEIEIRKIRLGQHCDAVDPALVARATHYLRSAARAGEPEAMLRYATGAHHGTVGQMGFIRDPDFEIWRREAPGMLLRAAQAGRVDAVAQLRMGYGSDSAPYAALIPDDPVQARAWDMVLARLEGRDRPERENEDPALERQAKALARQWHQRYFKGAVPSTGSGPSPTSLWPLDMPIKPPEQERFCE